MLRSRIYLRPLVHRLVTLGLVLSALAAGLARPAAAQQQHPNHVQGFQAERVYQLGELDNVNLFNGNLTVQIPLGLSYPAGGGLSYQLTLTYTGNVWDRDVWNDIDGIDRLMAAPRRTSNAGLGWQVSLGALDALNGYRSPDGAEHAFTSQLNAGSRIDTGYSYSTDGTYLRLNSTVSPKILELPDGTRKHFDASGRLTRIDDRFATANSVVITYPNSVHAGLKDWKIVDSQGRTHWIYFKPAPAQASLYNGGVVDRVVVTSFDGTAATYTFGYTTASVTRGMTDPNMTCTYATTTLTVPLLASLTLPATDTSGNLSSYEFGYDYGPYHSPCANGSGNLINTTDTSAHLTRMTLPTRGKIEWTWTSYLFPQRSTRIDLRYGTGPSWLEPFRRSAGVSQRKLTHENGSAGGTWFYTQTLTDANQSITKVKDPQNHETKHYFSVYACQPSFGLECPSQDPEPVSGWSYREYGLPFTRYTADGTRFLSSEAYEGAESAPNLRRRHFVRYEASGEKRNQRVASTRTIFSDDGSRYVDTDSSQFDGLGHYRSVVTSDNFPGSVSRTVYTEYNLGKSLTVIPAPTDPWVLETYTYQQVTDHISPTPQVSKVETCFDGDTGALKRSRAYKTGNTAGQTDVVVEYTRDTRGQVTQEKYFGGDGASLPLTGSLCTQTLSGLDYTITHTYQSGTLATSQYSGVTFKSVDRTIDPDTGLVQTDRDVSGLATSYEYDDLGRVTWMKPAQDGWTQYVYNVPTASTPTAKVWIYRRPNQGGTPLTTEEVHYDSFGRVELERRTMPDSTVSDRRTIYTTKGQLSSRTEWGSTARTEYLEYDAFGRPRRIRPPDGPAHDVTLAYTGIRQVARTVKVGTAWNGSAVTETSAVTTERYDRDGRLYQVLEPANPDGTNSTTTYAYDVGGRLKSVSQTAKKGTTASPQTRTFTYDNRGFLTSEKHPEKGASGNGTVWYWDYDARGNPGRIQDGTSDLTYTYDTAGRVTRVRETGSGFTSCATSWTSGPKCVKEYTYGTSNGTGDSRLGKVQVAKRYNYPVLGGTTYTAIVNQTYTYGGKQGRVSARETSLSFAGSTTERFDQTWSWNDLGEVASLGYPQCDFATYCTATQPRTVSSTYTQGFLTAVPGYATSISYHPNGQVNQVTRGNGVVDTYTKDPFHQSRPNKIEAKLGTTILWSTGVYAYDGAGNVTKTGASYYLYDGVSRIVSGTVYTGTGGGATGAKPFSHIYDGFGNLQSMSTGTGRSTDTDAATNRLKAGGFQTVGYDAAGNLTEWNNNYYQYDKLHQMSRMAAASGTETWLYMYDADGERVWSFKEGASPRFDRWTLRDLDGKVLRTYEATNYAWSWKEDHIYRGGTLIASVTPTGTIHLHTDHLGTVRAHTNSSGSRTAFHAYYPFGEEATAVNQNQQRMKFTAHERDLGNPTDAADDLDYMHARHYNGQVGRFISFDESASSARPGAPQTWNRYVYVGNNPLKYIDPDGNERAAVMQDIAVSQLLNGEISTREYTDTMTRPGPAAIVASAFVPGPEDFVIAAVALRYGGQVIARGGAAVLKSSDEIADAVRLTRAERLKANQATGNAYRDEVANALRAQGSEVTTEVTKKTPFGPRRLDIEVSHGGRTSGIETKTGNSPYTPAQRAKDAWLRLQGYTVHVVRKPPAT